MNWHRWSSEPASLESVKALIDHEAFVVVEDANCRFEDLRFGASTTNDAGVSRLEVVNLCHELGHAAALPERLYYRVDRSGFGLKGGLSFSTISNEVWAIAAQARIMEGCGCDVSALFRGYANNINAITWPKIKVSLAQRMMMDAFDKIDLDGTIFRIRRFMDHLGRIRHG